MNVLRSRSKMTRISRDRPTKSVDKGESLWVLSFDHLALYV